jgi:hypothetical protein
MEALWSPDEELVFVGEFIVRDSVIRRLIEDVTEAEGDGERLIVTLKSRLSDWDEELDSVMVFVREAKLDDDLVVDASAVGETPVDDTDGVTSPELDTVSVNVGVGERVTVALVDVSDGVGLSEGVGSHDVE